jgi:hypothetical protein
MYVTAGHATEEGANNGLGKIIAYLPMVPSNGACNGGHGDVVVGAVHVLIPDLGGWCRAAIVGAGKAAVDGPAATGRAADRVEFGRRLLGRVLCSSQGSGDANGSLERADASVILQRALDVMGRCGRDVHGRVECRAGGRVLGRLFVGMVVVGGMLGDGGRGRELGGHGGEWVEDAEKWVVGVEECGLIRTKQATQATQAVKVGVEDPVCGGMEGGL